MKTSLFVLVVVILPLLVLIIPLLGPIEPSRGERTRTTALVQSVAVGVDQLSWPGARGAYPPTGVEGVIGISVHRLGMNTTAGNELNRGIESVFVAFHDPDYTVPVDLPDEALSNTDGDTFPKNILPLTDLETAERLEIVDGWGNPLAYFNSADYEKPGRYVKIQMGQESGGVVVVAKPWKRPKTGLFVNPRSFQLFSAGADGIFNTADDIGNWILSR